MSVTVNTPLGVAATATAAATLAAGKHTPVDATAGALTMTLPASPAAGAHLSVEKVDSSANVVTVSGSIRGAASTINIAWQYETIEFIADSAGSWRPIAGHKTKSSLDGAYVAPTVIATASFGDGTTDATAHLQAKIDATPDGGWLHIPAGLYKITAALTITKNITITGAGVNEKYGAITNGAGMNEPVQSPYLYGTVLRQDTAATDGIKITGSGVAVHLRDFGIRFGDAIRMTNTGHGVNSVPTQTYSGALDNGLFHSKWERLSVYGHDGNHYGFRVVNGLYNTWSHLRSFGGGGYWIESRSNTGNYGNLVAEHTYAQILVGGTADGIHLKSGVSGGIGQLCFVTFIRCQVCINSTPEFASNPPTTAQRTFSAGEDGYASHYTMIGTDLEAPQIACIAVFGGGQRFIDSSGQVDNVSGYPAFNNPFLAQAVGVTGLPGAANPGRFVGVTAFAGPPTSGTFNAADFTLDPNGIMWVCTQAGTPGVWANPRHTGDLLNLGEENQSRVIATDYVTHPGSGIMHLVYFTARKTELAKKVQLYTGNTAAAATPTLIRVGLYEVASNGSLTLVDSTANDTTIFSNAYNGYTPTFTGGTYTKQAGKRYAVGLLIVSPAAMPTLVGKNGQPGPLGAPPMICSQVTGLSDLPSTVTSASQANNAPGKWFYTVVTN